MGLAKEKPESDIKALSFEQAVEALESIVERIESGEIGLEESLKQKRRGDALVQHCRAILDASEQQLEQMTADAALEED